MSEAEIEAAIRAQLTAFNNQMGGLTFLGDSEKFEVLTTALTTALADAAE